MLENTPDSNDDPIVRPRVRFYKMPPSIPFPVADYYATIPWKNGFDQWNLVRFATPGDGSCLFHAISNSFFPPYHTQTLDGQPITRNKMVAHLRSELADLLASPIGGDKENPSFYETLNHGNTAVFAEHVPEFSLSHMQSELRSTRAIGYGYLEFIGNALDKDIYILEAIRRDIYHPVDEDLPLMITGDRPSIILYYMDNGHYELVGIKNSDDTFVTHFQPTHSLIRFLYQRVNTFVERSQDD